MPKIVLPAINSGYISGAALTSAFDLIEAAFENTVSRDGTLPNNMEADIDMNSKRLLNLPFATGQNEPVTLAQLNTLGTAFITQQQEILTASASQTVFTFNTLTYQPGSLNLGVFVNGIRKFVGQDYTETSSTSVTFLVGLTAGDKVVAQTNQSYGSLSLPTIPLIPWSNLTGIPEFASRWPTYAEVTGKPSTFTPAAHVHSTADITSGTGLADARRGVWVQAGTPTAGRTGELWFW